jgi:hypothetical protein
MSASSPGDRDGDYEIPVVLLPEVDLDAAEGKLASNALPHGLEHYTVPLPEVLLDADSPAPGKANGAGPASLLPPPAPPSENREGRNQA